MVTFLKEDVQTSTSVPIIATALMYRIPLHHNPERLLALHLLFDASSQIKGVLRKSSHPSIATTLGNIGGLYLKQGRLVKAEAVYDECLKMQRETHGRDANHEEIRSTLQELSRIRGKRNG